VNCYGGADGVIAFGIVGGTPPYLYSLNPNIQQATTPFFNNLSAGPYSITVTDSNGCFDNKSATILQPTSKLSLSATVSNTKCAGAYTGEIVLSAVGGTPSYSFDIANQSSMNDTFSNLASGIYNCTVVDANNCIDTLSTYVGEDTVSLTTTFKRNETCVPGTDGEIHVAGIPSSNNYLYSLDSTNWSSVNQFKNLTKGNYTIYLQDPIDGCLAKTVDTIDFINNIPLDDVVVNQMPCHASPNGSIAISNTNYTYSLVPNAGVLTQNGFNNVPAGTYNLIATKANGCTGEKSVTLIQPDSLYFANIIVSPTNIYCFGKIDVTAAGGTPPLTYKLSPTAKQDAPGLFTGLCKGDYKVTVTDTNNCSLSVDASVLTTDTAGNVFGVITVSPNPADQQLVIEAPFELELAYQLVNTMGQRVLSAKKYGKTFTIPTGTFSAGVYVLYLQSLLDNTSVKILIQH
jgi:hypothetical protein